MESVVRTFNNIKNILKVNYIKSCLLIIYLLVLLYEITYIYFVNYTNSIGLKNCFLSIENFVTVRQLSSNMSNCKTNNFDMKTYASSYSSPYLIELIHNSQRDCLCCPKKLTVLLSEFDMNKLHCNNIFLCLLPTVLSNCHLSRFGYALTHLSGLSSLKKSRHWLATYNFAF